MKDRVERKILNTVEMIDIEERTRMNEVAWLVGLDGFRIWVSVIHIS